MKPDAARRALNRAVASGTLVRPTSCDKCGVTPKQTSDGRAAIQGHHHDYCKPLDVQWICARCHRKETPLPLKPGAPAFGSINGQAKLNETQANKIRTSPLGCKRLARIYGVHKTTIQRIRNGTHWVAATPTEAPNDQA